MTIIRFIARMWFYFRTGYGTYLTFMLGALNTLVVVWYLAIQNVPAVQRIFASRFVVFAIFAIVVGIPLSVGIGWAHFKKTPAFSAEADIGIEANPWVYKLQPGIWKEVFTPLYLELLVQQKRLLEAHGLLNAEDKSRIERLENATRLILEGGVVGRP